MIEVYYVSNTSSGRTTMQWLESHDLLFIERRITKKTPIKTKEIKKMLALTENGFEDLINKRAKKFKELEKYFYDFSVYELIEYLIESPTLLKLPIVMSEKKIVTGFNKAEIRCFLSKEYRRTKLLKIDSGL